jgi:hypothetical protein
MILEVGRSVARQVPYDMDYFFCAGDRPRGRSFYCIRQDQGLLLGEAVRIWEARACRSRLQQIYESTGYA